MNWEAKLAVKDEDGDDGPDCIDGLTMFLLLEMEKGTNSSYYDYIQVLPTSHETSKFEQVKRGH